MDITKPHVFNFDSRTFDKEPIFKIVKLKITHKYTTSMAYDVDGELNIYDNNKIKVTAVLDDIELGHRIYIEHRPAVLEAKMLDADKGYKLDNISDYFILTIRNKMSDQSYKIYTGDDHELKDTLIYEVYNK